jgi:CBS domain-containing protein
MRAGELCRREVVTVHKDDTIVHAARRMREAHVGDVVVVDPANPRVPVGILTDRDIVVGVVAKDINHIGMLEVGDVLSRDKLVTARESDDLQQALSRMKTHGVRRMPVINMAGQLVGILTFDDLVEHLSRLFAELSRLLSREIKEEQLRRAS